MRACSRVLLLNLERQTGAFTALGHRFGEQYSLARSDVAALIVITEAGEQGESIGTVELARRTGVTAPSAIVLVDRLGTAGLLTRHPHPRDRRRIVLTLTTAARLAGRDHFGVMNDGLLQLLGTYTTDDLRRLRRLPRT